MAFNEKELDIIKVGIQNGKTQEEVEKALLNYRNGIIPQKETEERASIWERLQGGASEAVDRVGNVAGELADKFAEEPTKVGKVVTATQLPLKVGAELSRIAGETLMKPVMGASEKLGEKIMEKFPDITAPEEAFNKAMQGIGGVLESIKGTVGEDVYNSLADSAELLSWVVGGKAAKGGVETGLKTGMEATKPVIQAGKEIVSDIGGKAKTSLFGKPAQNVDDVLKQADEALKPQQKLAITEAGTAQPSLLEKWAGIRTDIKNRIAGKQDLLKEYFDTAHARNNFDTMPTPLEFAVKKGVEPAMAEMERLLADTGSKIGSFRKKIGTYKADIDSVNFIENSFVKELQKLNLELKNGVITQKPGTVSKVVSDSEISTLSDLYQNLLVVKQSPDLTRLIDLRNLFDSKINFAKASRDVSSALDSFSRQIRKDIADVSAKIVGKSEAGNLKKYSDFMDGYNELRSFTDRKAGAEFLLKQVLSERGRLPREVMETIKEFTGIDLLDHATMASIATDLIGNSAQKGVFRQEITKAGLDAAKILKGDVSGAIETAFNFLKKGVVNEEKQFLKAAE